MAPQLFYWIVDGLVVLGVVGFCAFLLRSFRHCPRPTRDIILMLLIWLGILTVAVFRWAVLASTQGRLAFPALGAVALILVVGWAELIPARMRQPVGVTGLAAWGTAALLCAVLVIKPAYTLPQRADSLAELATAPSELHVYFSDCCQLVGYVPPAQPAQPGDWIPLSLVWRVTAPMDTNHSMFVHARTTNAQLVGQLDTYHGSGMYPTALWRTGEIIADTVYVPLDPAAETPNMIQFYVGMYDRTTMEHLTTSSAEGAELESIIAGEAALIPARWPEFELKSTTDTVFAGRIQLAAVGLPQQPVQSGEVATITLYWHALQQVTEDFTGFIHLLNASEDMIAQDDHPARDGHFTTRLWPQGAVLSDPFCLALSTDLAEGSYELRGGLYHPESVHWLEAIQPGTGERWKEDLVKLGTLLVADPKD